MSAVTGIEHEPIRAAALRSGLTETVFDMLLTACERGFVEAINERDDGST